MKPLPSPSTAELLQIPITLIHTLKRGNINLQINGAQNIQLQIENNKVDLNFQQKEPLKTLLELEAKIEEQTIVNKLKNLKNTAEKLRQNQLTITISYRGQRILTIGKEAKPTISQTLSETTAIEINNLIELVKLLT